jgi:hypothetical protein
MQMAAAAVKIEKREGAMWPSIRLS